MRKQLRNQEIREIQDFIVDEALENADRIEILEDDNGKFILIDQKTVLFKYQDNWIYTLRAVLQGICTQHYKQIKVDKGAIRFVAGGADVMRPGIVDIKKNIEKNEIVIIREETHDKPLAIGKALFSSAEIENKDSGKVIKSLHYVSDKIWNKS